MSTQITRKSSDDNKAVLSPPPPGVLVDAGGQPVAPAPRLGDLVRGAFLPSHGLVPDALPVPPVGLEDLGPAPAFRVLGPEREAWLQGVQTADLKSVGDGGATLALFLGGKGRIVAEALLWRRLDEVRVSTRPDKLEALLAHLDRLLIMEDAELQPAPGLHRLRWHPGETPAGGPLVQGLTGANEPLGFELLVEEERARALLAAFPERPDPAALEAYRVALGVPLFGQDYDEEVTPLEAGQDRAISFGKGCYVGQEVVAMATFRGRVQWNLVRLQVDGAPPERGSGIDPARGPKGRVTSAVQVGSRSLLLGYVHREKIAGGSTVALADGRAATVLGLPFGSKPGAGVCA